MSVFTCARKILHKMRQTVEVVQSFVALKKTVHNEEEIKKLFSFKDMKMNAL